MLPEYGIQLTFTLPRTVSLEYGRTLLLANHFITNSVALFTYVFGCECVCRCVCVRKIQVFSSGFYVTSELKVIM